MAIIIKTKKEIEILQEGGKRLAMVLRNVAKAVVPGVSTHELDQIAFNEIKKLGDEPAFLNYQPYGADRPYPASLCVSVNEEIVHGIPSKDRILKKGDIVSIDLGLKHKGYFTDHAVTVAVGKTSKENQKLLDVTKEALDIGIQAMKVGGKIGDIGHAIESYVKEFGYGIVRGLSGHGVGKYIHEDPYVPNYGKAGAGETIEVGMVIAIEPMITLGSHQSKLLKDGYTIVSKDGSYAAHFEHTVAVTEKGIEVLTA